MNKSPGAINNLQRRALACLKDHSRKRKAGEIRDDQ